MAIEEKDKGTVGRMYCNMGNCLRAIIEIDRAEECYCKVRFSFLVLFMINIIT